jgi:hypothetical protein
VYKRQRGLGDVYKRQAYDLALWPIQIKNIWLVLGTS